MRIEQNIPLFLWVAAALVVHAIGGGGATEVAERIAETLDIRDFAADVRRQARYAGSPVEVSILSDEPSESEQPEPATDVTGDESDEVSEEEVDSTANQPDTPKDVTKVPEEEKPPPPVKAPEPEKQEQKETPAAPELQVAQPPPPQMRPDRRVAVEQHVENKNQEDNPDASFIAEHANRVEEETRARITANDSNADAPSMGGPSQSNGPEHGNSDITEVAQSDASPGRTDRAAGETGSDVEKETRAAAAAQRSSSTPEQPAIVARGQQQVPGRQGQEAREATQASESQDARPEVMSTPGGSYDVAHAREAQKHAQAQQARQALAGLDRRTPRPVLGLGSAGTTQNGINLNLSFSAAHAIVGADEISMMRKRDGERRLSQHRGSWTSMGLERWKPALENYVASVKPGNQTALNTAHSPFARYLNQIHQRLHEVFAYRFLGHLDKLPANHPLNNMDINTHLEIALSREDGRIVRMGVTKSSGVTAFDVGALDSVEKAAPYGPPPSSIVSPDGNVYLHWEFHRKPIYACSTYNAHPYILNADQKSAPPRVAPPKQPDYEKTPEKKPAQRSGSRSAPTPKLRPVSPT